MWKELISVPSPFEWIEIVPLGPKKKLQFTKKMLFPQISPKQSQAYPKKENFDLIQNLFRYLSFAKSFVI
jgi:hypothetical protein